jgi:hypothetical protein
VQAQLNWVDKTVNYFNPEAGLKRAGSRLKMQAATDDGYVIPGSRKKSMKGVTARSNSPDVDITDKLDGTRALGRDLYMNSSLASAIVKRHKLEAIGAGLQLQSAINYEFLGISKEDAGIFEKEIEREFDLFCESVESDFDHQHDLGTRTGLGSSQRSSIPLRIKNKIYRCRLSQEP